MPFRLDFLVSLQFAERGDGMHRQPSALDGTARLTAEARSLRCSDLRHVGSALDEQDVRFSGLAEAVGDTTTNSTAADDDVFCVGDLRPYFGEGGWRFHFKLV